MINKNLPSTIVHTECIHKFGIFKLTHTIEDRMPHIQENSSKYKHYINVKFLWFKYSFVIRSRSDYQMYKG